MAETFFLRVADAGTATWGAFDSHRAARRQSRARPVAVRTGGARRPALHGAGRLRRRSFSRSRAAGGEPSAPASARPVLARRVVGRRCRPNGLRDWHPAALGSDAGCRGRAKASGHLARRVALRGNRAACLVLRSRRYSGYSRDARAHHRRRANCRAQAWSGPVRVRRSRAEPSSVARARTQARRAGAASRSRVHRRGRPRPLRRRARCRSPASSRAPT